MSDGQSCPQCRRSFRRCECGPDKYEPENGTNPVNIDEQVERELRQINRECVNGTAEIALIGLAIVMLLVLFGCAPNKSVTNKTSGVIFGDEISTIEYDGHRYIVYRGEDCVAMIPHPGVKAEKE